MPRRIVLLILLLSGSTLHGPAAAFDPAHLDRLLRTHRCRGCDLTGADLGDADLTGADLDGADLFEADTTDAEWGKKGG